MKTLRRTLEEYLALRRNLGFKLRSDGAHLTNFVLFYEEEERTTYHNPLCSGMGTENAGETSEQATHNRAGVREVRCGL